MSQYFDHETDSRARERADLLREAREMQEVEPAPRCCLESANFEAVPCLERDLHTGYLEGTYYRCTVCQTRICEEDFAALVEYENSRDKLQAEMEENPVPAEFEVPVKKAPRVA